MDHCLSYREVIPTNISPEEWVEVEINTGTQHTLQDIKTSEKSGGFCYQNLEHIQDRNRFIYWRIYQDFLELTEISLDYTLTKNKVRLRFTDTTVLAVSITEHENNITLLVATISSLHRFVFPHHVDTKSNLARVGGFDKESRHSNAGTISSSSSTADTSSIRLNNLQSFSIFRDITSNPSLRDPNTYQVIDGNGSMQNQLPHAATCFVSQEGNEAYFALAYQTKLMFHVMNTSNGNFTAHELKEPNLMPRFLSNLKGALIGRTDPNDYSTSLAFCNIDGVIFLLALYRSDNLRLWSTVTLQSVSTISCLQSSTTEHTQGLQNSSLRKINDERFCVYISHSTFAEFVCVDIQCNVNEHNGNNINLVRRRSIQAPPIDMADYGVSESRIWALWNNAEGEFSISSFALKQNMSMEWVSAALEPPPPDRYSLTIEQGVDPREAYCSYIFLPGKFDRTIITKALYMFRRANMFLDMKQLTMSVLKEQVCQAVEDEIQNEMKEFVVSDEEYLEIALRLWERFYSCCEQYHLKDAEPIGIVIIDTIDTVCVVRKQSFSLLRPCDLLEHLMLVGEDADSTAVVQKYFSDSYQEGKDLSNVLMILSDIEKWLPEETKIELDKKMYQLEMPAVLIGKLTDDLLAGDTERQTMPESFLTKLRQKLQIIKNLCHAVNLLHNMLRVGDENDEQQTHTELSQTSRAFLSIGSLFGSEYGLSVVSETIKQTVRMRFALCRNLLILQQILIDTFLVPMDTVEALRSRFMPDTIVFLQAYYIMVWIAETPVSLSAPPTLETSMQRLCQTQLLRDVNRIYSSYSRLISSTTLLHLFLQSKGLYSALSLFVSSNKYQERQHTFQYTLQPLINYVNRLIWVVSHEFVFGEWLFSTCQHVIIQDYVRQLATWCEWNIHSRQFILAVSLLDCGEINKAYNHFIKCGRGVLKEKFLFERILKNTPLYNSLEHIIGPEMNTFTPEIEISNQAVAFYYLKVIRLFEQHQALNYIISLAEVVIGLLDKKDSQLPMFQSIVFNNHLQLEHFEEAYHSLIYNADLSRRKDCLRQLVITLFQRKRLDLLIRFPYATLYDDFELIVETRARSLTMEQNEVYNFLYAFHVNNENMRKASSIMYEQACRYLIEIDTPDALQKRCDSLLVCINAMQLTDERYRWIVKPPMGDDANLYDTNDDTRGTQEVVVLTIDDLRRELQHSEALKELSYHRKDIHSYVSASAQELSYLLGSCGLFTSAIALGKSFGVSLLPIFDSLTVACVRTTDDKVADVWKWLQENNLCDLAYQNKATNMAWLLMQKLIEENEGPDSSSISKTVVNKLLVLNKFVPQWLFNSYKSKNCPELLNLFVKYNRLLEAADLAIEMINAMLGSGSEYFNFKHPIGVSNPPLALPVNVLDVLLHGLKLNSRVKLEYKVAHVYLEDAIARYVHELSIVKTEKVKTAYKQRQQNR